MNSNLKLAALQQSQIQKYSKESAPHTFFNLLTNDRLLAVVEDLQPEYRERSFPPTETLSLFLAQAMNADRSCQNIVNEVALTKSLYGMAPCSSNTGSYCKARKRLPVEMVSELVRHTGREMSKHTPQLWKWKGRSVRLIDGTTVELPDTKKNQEDYPQNEKADGCPLARVVAIICLASGGVLDAAMSPVSGKG